MDAKDAGRDSRAGITRRELEAVIRRAAELAAADADADERIPEDEVLRIASEIGLPARHVRQAMLELPTERGARTWLDRTVGPAVVGGVRVVAGRPEPLYRRLEDHLTTREYLQPLRRQHGRGWYAPADDAISKIARGFSRPASRHYLARARRVMLAVEPIGPDSAHVRLDVDLADRRRVDGITGGVLGGLAGVVVGSGLAIAAGGAVGDAFGSAGGVAAAVLAFGGTATASVSAGFALARARFRRRLAAARLEITWMLDRIEQGEPLDPPPAPWRRRLRDGLSRHLTDRR